MFPKAKSIYEYCEIQYSHVIQLIKGLLDIPDQDKENEVRNAQATQAVIQRRRRPKRRSTGVVHIDMDVSCTP